MNKVERDGGWEDGCERCGESMRLMGRREQQRERERESGGEKGGGVMGRREQLSLTGKNTGNTESTGRKMKGSCKNQSD